MLAYLISKLTKFRKKERSVLGIFNNKLKKI